MQKFLRFLMLTALFLPFALQAQNTLTVCSGTVSNEYVPFQGWNADAAQHNQLIYPADSLTGMIGQAITQMVFYIDPDASNGSYTAADRLGTWTVSLGETTATTLSGLDNTTSLTEVYEGYFDCSTGTLTLVFNNSYVYTGGNLLVDLNHAAASYNRWYFLGVTATGAAYTYSSQRNFLPKCTFTYGAPPTCLPVSGLGLDAAQTTSSSLTLTWTDALNTGATYTVYDMADNSVVQSGLTGTTYTVTGLNANTGYTFGVEANCSATDASTMKTTSGRTACGALTSLPWTEGFENIPSGNYQMPFCWSRYTSAYTSSATYPYSYSSNAHSGSRSLYFFGTTGDSYPDTMVAIAPEVDVTLYPMSASRVTFWARMGTASNTKKAYVGTMTNPADISTFTVLDSVTVSGNTYTLFSVPMTNATGAYAAIMVFKGSGTMYVDDFTIEEMPSCLEVSNLTVSGTAANSVTLTWTDTQNPDGTTYTVYNMADTSDVYATVTGNVAVIDNLSPNTNYTFGVQANCAAGDANFMTISVLTDCATETFPWSENFDNWSSKSPCWTFMSGALSGTPTVYSSAWSLTSSSYGSNITLDGKAMTMNVYSTNRYWMVTPPIHITDNAALFSADVAVAAWSSLTPNYDANDTLAFALSTDGGSTFTTLLVLNNTQLNALPNTYTNLSVPVVGYNGQDVRFAIFAGSSASGGDNRIAIDNVAVGVAPNCLPVADLTASDITSSSISLSWNDENNSGATYTVYDMSDTSVIATGVSTTSYEVTGLTASTPYTFGVVTNCSADEASAFAIVNAATGCAGESCQITIVGEDSYGDGWNGADINILQNGITVGSFTLPNGSTLSESFSVCSGVPVSFSWNAGSYPGETSFEIHDGGGATAYTATDGSSVSSGVFFTLNEACPSCIPPAITVSEATANSVTITWTGSAASYDVYEGTTFVTSTTNNTYTFTNLTASTGYTFGVQAICAADDSSSIATVNVVTDCAGGSCQITITGADSYGDGWADDEGYYFSTLTISQNGATIGTFTLETGYSNSESYSVCSDAPLSFSWTSNSDYDNEASFEIRDANNAVLFAVADGSTLSDGVFLTLNSPCSNCAMPGNLTLGASTQTSATISWTGTASSYSVYNGTTFVADVTDTTYTFTGLTPGTTYVFGVMSVCSAADSSIMATIQMMTDCEDVTTLPYYESFEGDLGCWTTVNGSSDGVDWMSFNCTNFQNADAHAGASVASSWSWSSTAMHANAWMISPKFVLPSTTDSLTFSWWEITSSQYPDKYSVSLSTTTNDTAAFTTVLRPYAAAAGTWTIQTADLTAYAGQSVYIAFHHVDYDENYLFIDDISLFQGGYVPPAPDTLTVTFEVDNPAMGTTIPAPGTYQYITGDTIHFGSQANPGYHFLKWEVTLGSQTQELGSQYANGYYVLASSWMHHQNVTFKAFFEAGNPDSTTVTYAVNDATKGTTTPAPGTYTIYVGDYVTATATPNSGCSLSAWVLEFHSSTSLLTSDTIFSDDEDFANPMNFGSVPQSFADNNYTITVVAIFDGNPIPVDPCDVPTGLHTTTIENEAVSIAWDANADVNSWNIQYRVAGTATWSTATANTNSYTITGLTGLTNYEIQVQADCGDGNTSDWSGSITATTTNVGIESWLENSVTLFPNPATNVVNVQCTMNDVQWGGELHLFDVYGKLLQTVPVTSELTPVNVSGLADGVYFVRVTTEQGVVTKSFVKR